MSIEITHNLEKAVVTILNFDDWQLTWTGETNSLYDAEGLTPEKNGKRTRCVIEMKFRKKYYEKKLIEKRRGLRMEKIDQKIKVLRLRELSDLEIIHVNSINQIKVICKNSGQTHSSQCSTHVVLKSLVWISTRLLLFSLFLHSPNFSLKLLSSGLSQSNTHVC